jgi:hypothetical protein
MPETFTKLDFARWYRSFNRFIWPDDFPAPKPDFWVNNNNFKTHTPEQRKLNYALCDVLELMAGKKLCSRIWNSEMTDNEFNKWWERWGR